MLLMQNSRAYLSHLSTGVGFYVIFLFEILQSFLMIHIDVASGSRLSKIIRVMNHNQK